MNMGNRGKDLDVKTKDSILSMVRGGIKSSKVAEILGLHKSTISKVFKRYRELPVQ